MKKLAILVFSVLLLAAACNQVTPVQPTPTPTSIIPAPITPSTKPTPKPTPSPSPVPLPKPNPSPAPVPSNPEVIIRKVGDQESSFLIQKINSNSVDGLWFRIYPIASEVGVPRTLQIGDDIGYACEGISEKLTSIDFFGQTVTFTKIVGLRPKAGCPICLSGSTLIDTPSGKVLVKDLQIGMFIWTIDKAGHRVSGVITKTSKVPVPLTHKMVDLILSDGREVFASPGHPTVDGRTVQDLAVGDIYNGSSVVSANLVSYHQSATYDILPDSDTGYYWANGILLGSTLKP